MKITTILTEKFSLRLVYVGFILLLGSVCLFLWKVSNFSINLPINTEKFDHFGGFISGAVGTMWSLAGVILFYVALQEQRKDVNTNQKALNTQVRAFEQQILEFEVTRKEFAEQSKTLKTQQFESTFFNTFSLLNNITENINFTISPPDPRSLFYDPASRRKSEMYYGKDSFKYFYEEFKKDFQSLFGKYVTHNIQKSYTPGDHFDVPLKVHESIVESAYESFFNKYQADLGHYFRTLYTIIKFVKEQNPEHKKYYTNLVRSQLSSFEHLLLFYNCLSSYGVDKFKPLIIEYSLLDNMPFEKLLDIKHKEFYPTIAY